RCALAGWILVEKSGQPIGLLLLFLLLGLLALLLGTLFLLRVSLALLLSLFLSFRSLLGLSLFLLLFRLGLLFRFGFGLPLLLSGLLLGFRLQFFGRRARRRIGRQLRDLVGDGIGLRLG